MEEFHELVGQKFHGKPTGKLTAGGSVAHLDLKVGETKVVALKKYKLGPPPEVIVSIARPDIAFCFQVSKLKDKSKKTYIDKNMSFFNDQLVPVEANGYYLYQICGKTAGSVELTAVQRQGAGFTPYATPVKIDVAEDKRGLSLGASFATLWKNHPLQPANGQVSYPCNGLGQNDPGYNKPLYKMQCMVRLCTALHKSGVNLSGMANFTSCKLFREKGLKEHEFHFSDPYDFPHWNPARGQGYTWAAKSPYVPEPMPGLAAYWFVQNRTGIILFDHYFDVKGREPMFGGHIDLWNKNTMGNTIGWSNAYEGLSAFLRARRIMFWSID